MKILGALLELPAKQHCQSRAPGILIFSNAMGANYSFNVKFIATRAPTFFGYIILVLAIVPVSPQNHYLLSLIEFN